MFPLSVNSNAPNDQVTGTGSNFTVKFPRGMKVMSKPNYRWHIALVKATYRNTIPNISPNFNNNKFYYSVDSGATWKTITFPRGYYQLKQIDAYIRAEITANGDDLPGGFPIIKVEPNTATMRVTLYISNDAPATRVKFEANETFTELIGFNAGTYSTIYEGDNPPEIDRGIDNLSIMCDTLVDRSFSLRDGINSSLIYTVPMTGLPSELISFEPSNLVWVPMAKSDNDLIDSATFMWIDPRNREVDFNGFPTSLFFLCWNKPDDV